MHDDARRQDDLKKNNKQFLILGIFPGRYRYLQSSVGVGEEDV
jgi:hypothetical protein